ncbi:DUF6452 family protein [Winogradskyella sp.]|uniref:DUF6452 family protein n=1 Tax=Winogradskyella sp. TaxID=1883156 RepID=UPI00262FFE42|nr:DUF6452 family protein [Winogradskyella sp.]
MHTSNKIITIAVLALFLAIGMILQSCERDDICAETTPTTPRLLIEFYDVNDTDELKSVARLTAYGEGLVTDEAGMPTEPTENNIDGTIIFNSNANVIELPLLIGNENEITTSRFILEKDTNLRLDEDDTTVSNVDIIEVSYSSEFVYVSRACGYKSIFNNLDINFEASDGSTWISNIETVVTIVENENTAHVRILH